jgi:hypothetical protein
VATLLVVAWNVVAGANRPQPGSPPVAAPADVPESPSPLPALPGVTRPDVPALLPGLNLDSAFWRARLDQLNREQVYFEALEWRIVHAATDAMRRYLESVVVPAVQRAERAGNARAASPSPRSW